MFSIPEMFPRPHIAPSTFSLHTSDKTMKKSNIAFSPRHWRRQLPSEELRIDPYPLDASHLGVVQQPSQYRHNLDTWAEQEFGLAM